MSPQENVSDPAPTQGVKSPFSPVCAEVRVVMDAVRDGRATPAERTFVATHTQYCPECSSEWAFLRSTKTAWARTPMEVPSASLSARIAAMTYRKPTFSQQVASAFAFLNPVPVRVAIGVAAVAGLSFFVLPRMSVVPGDMTPPVTDSLPSIAREVPTVRPESVPSAIAATPVWESAPVAKKVIPKPILPATKGILFVATESSVTGKQTPLVVSVVEKPAPKVAPAVSKLKRVQVARNAPKPIREALTAPVESALTDVAPPVAEPESRIAAATPSPAPAVVSPEAKSPTVAPAVAAAGIVAPETNPDFTGGSTRISLNNTNQRSSINMSGKSVRTASSSDAGFIVAIDAKL